MKPAVVSNLPPEGRPSHRLFLPLIAVTLAFTFFEVSFDAAVRATPYNTRDSAGRTMGFNDPFSPEHYGIVLGNMSLSGGLGLMLPWGWALVGAQVLGARLLMVRVDRKWIMRFCLLQPIAFCPGLPGILMLVAMPLDILFLRTQDREGFIDVPPFPYMGAGLWILTCAGIAWRFRARQVPKPAGVVGETGCASGSA